MRKRTGSVYYYLVYYMYVATGVANPVANPLAAAVSRCSVRGIGSLAVAYGGALAVRCALSVCCIAPNW